MPRLSLILILLLGTWAHSAEISFNRDIRPILSDNCFYCHGTDEKNRQAGRRLDTFEGATADQDGVRALVPGDVSKSALWVRINSTDEDQVMPPPKSHKTITAAQKEKLRQWILEGAKYEQHWSLVPLAPVKVPPVQRSGWPRNDLDRFILARLESENLTPSPEATKETLIRRLALDLTGLPPTLAEVDVFLADQSEQAYSRIVEHFLGSPHYGERMAVDWLDAARYADTNGYQVDRDRELWPWRDWVIKAFNENKPFDQFTVEQLAGDLLPNPTLEQRIATGFHRNHMMNEEGGIIAEEFLAEYTADRVETTAAVWLGQTFNCCRCHDHKFDPFTQRDFYSLKAFFHNVPERGVGIYANPIRQNSPPFVKLSAPAIEAKVQSLKTQQEQATERLAAFKLESAKGTEEWAQRIATATVEWKPIDIRTVGGGDVAPRVDELTRAVKISPQSIRAKPIKINGQLPMGRFTALRLEFATAEQATKFQWSGLKVMGPVVEGGKAQPLTLRAIAEGDSLAATETAKAIDNDRKTEVAIAVKLNKPVAAVLELATPLVVGDSGVEIAFEIGIESAEQASLLKIFSSDAEPEVFAPTEVQNLAKKASSQWTVAERQRLSDLRLSQQPKYRDMSAQAERLKQQLTAAELEIPTSLVMEEMPEPRPTFVLLRGAYDKPGERVTAATPAVLPEFPASLPRNRLGLAQWLVSSQNPLTARVTVNRLWQQVFGSGLVKTSEDFGSQGAPPSHPELLDWLAQEFIRSGWDVKHLMTLMVTSATYRQQSQLTPELRQRDPENRLLARAPRIRLPGEIIRDQALAASGLLVEAVGGPSVKPYHPAGLYEQVTAGKGYNLYTQDHGDNLRRRSMYTYWKRSVPHPAMLLFDAPFRETCTLSRPRTNTPLQALNLMNDPTYVEAARFLAQRMMRGGETTVQSRLVLGFRLLLTREPKAAELAVLEAAYKRAFADFQSDGEAAKRFLTVGDAGIDANLDQAELAAFTSVASTLLCLDETVTKQ